MAAPADHFVPPDEHREPGFLLRSLQPGDGARLAEAVNTSYEHLKTFLSWVEPEQSVERSEQRCRECRGRWLTGTDFVIGVWESDESRLLGSSGFHLREGGIELCNAEIGMWIRADAAGRGLGTRVLQALVGWGFSEWPWLRLSWRCSDANVASRRTAEKAGLQLEGILRSNAVDPGGRRRDTYCYAALREEWQQPGARTARGGH